MKIARLICLQLLILIIITSISGVSAIQGNISQENKIVMLIINRLDLDELGKLKEIQRITEEGSIGLMNIRASGRYSEYKSYATIGWGTRAEANVDSEAFFNLDREIHGIYDRRMGDVPASVGVINLAINQLIQQNIRGEFGAVPGNLGTVLRENGLRTVVLGNADTDDLKIRPVAFIPMDQKGFIDYGDVSSRLFIKNPQKPYGIQTNYELLFNEFVDLYPKGDFIVVETGDMSRLEGYKNNLNDQSYQYHRETILQEVNQFTKKIAEHIKKDNTLLMIVVPYPPNLSFEAGARLTPVVFYGGRIKGGVLTSDTTRREGIIGNIDIAPTVLSHFGLSSQEMTGRPIQELSWKGNYEYLLGLNKSVLNTSQQRYRVLYTFAVFEMLASVLALLTIIFKKRISYRWRAVVTNLLLATIIAPFTLLILSFFGYLSMTMIYLLLVGITFAIVMGLRLALGRDSIKILIWSTGLIVIGLVFDIITGQMLIKNSILGYDPIIGARYYGIGNEFAGVFIGSTLIFSTAILEKKPMLRWFLPFFYLFIVIVIGFPKWGANVGGTISAMFAFLFTLLRLLGNHKVSFKKWIAISGAVALGVGIFAIADLFFLESKSHLAGAIQQIYRGGPLVILRIITRKIAMNLRIMEVTIWSRVLLMAIVVLGVLFHKPMGVLKKIASTYSQLAVGWSGILVASGVGFLVNDSGVVTAALAVIFLSTSILYLVLNDLEGQLAEK